jgi:hypothetical protein
MSRINRVEVQEFAFELPDLGFDAGEFNIVFQPKNTLKMSKYAIAMWILPSNATGWVIARSRCTAGATGNSAESIVSLRMNSSN